MIVKRQCPLLKTDILLHCLIFVVTDRKFEERVRIGRHLGPTVISESILVKLCHKSQHVPRVSPRVRNLIKPTSESFEQQEIIFAIFAIWKGVLLKELVPLSLKHLIKLRKSSFRAGRMSLGLIFKITIE